jgi:hypothetical protein
MKIYCPQCGNPTAYTGAKPKFCSSCGNALSALAKEEQKNYVIHEDIDIEEDPSEQVNLENINGLDVEIESFSSNKVTIGDIIKSEAAEVKGELNLPKVNAPQQTSSQIMEEFKKEAGTLRNKNAQ